MSKTRKHLTNTNNFPVPKDKEKVVRVLEIRGSNQVLAQYPDKSEILCLMPNKFRKILWISKGHYLIIKEAEVTSNTSGYQIKGIIVHILMDDEVKNLKKINMFPKEFEEIKEQEQEKKEDDDESEEEEEEEAQSNPNRVVFSDEESDEYETEEEDNAESGEEIEEESEEEVEEIDDTKKIFFNRRIKGKK